MPAVAAHYLFGQAIIPKLDSRLRNLIHSNREFFDLGLQGPDILFYCNPLSVNPVSKRGHDIHNDFASNFLLNSIDYLRESNAISWAYILGFICHFTLDSQCHPIIANYVQSGTCTHIELETELDRLVLELNNYTPHFFKRYETINYSKLIVKFISPFYKGVTSEQITKSIKSMRFYNWLLFSPYGPKLSIIKLSEKLLKTNGAFAPLAITSHINSKCLPLASNLHKIYLNSIDIAVNNIYNYIETEENGKELDKYFYQDFN